MADIPNILPYVKPDFVTPLQVASEIAERRRNADTQRMFAENTARRMGAQEKREQAEFQSRQDELKRSHGIEKAKAIAALPYMSPAAQAATAAG